MKSLYTLTINGNMHFFLGDIPTETYDLIDQIANKIKFEPNDDTNKEYIKTFVKEVFANTNIEIIPIKVSYVFRKKLAV